MREDNRVEVVMGFFDDLASEDVCEIARDLDFEWAYVYSLSELLDDYYDGQLDEIINAFGSSSATAYEYGEYVVDDGYIMDVSDLEYNIDDHYEVIADRLVDYYDRGFLGRYINVSDYEGLEDILKDDGSYEWQDVMDALGGKENDLMREAIDEVKEFDDSEHINDFLELAKRTYVAWHIVEHFDKTHFCGIDESRYGEIIECFENGSTAFALMVEEIIGNAVNGITIEKATEMFVKKHWM